MNDKDTDKVLDAVLAASPSTPEGANPPPPRDTVALIQAWALAIIAAVMLAAAVWAFTGEWVCDGWDKLNATHQSCHIEWGRG